MTNHAAPVALTRVKRFRLRILPRRSLWHDKAALERRPPCVWATRVIRATRDARVTDASYPFGLRFYDNAWLCQQYASGLLPTDGVGHLVLDFPWGLGCLPHIGIGS